MNSNIQVESRKGLTCPFKPILCQEGYCQDCQIYLDYQQGNSKIVGLWNKNHEICGDCYASRTALRDMLKEGGRGNLTIVEIVTGNCPACKKAIGGEK